MCRAGLLLNLGVEWREGTTGTAGARTFQLVAALGCLGGSSLFLFEVSPGADAAGWPDSCSHACLLRLPNPDALHLLGAVHGCRRLRHKRSSTVVFDKWSGWQRGSQLMRLMCRGCSDGSSLPAPGCDGCTLAWTVHLIRVLKPVMATKRAKTHLSTGTRQHRGTTETEWPLGASRQICRAKARK